MDAHLNIRPDRVTPSAPFLAQRSLARIRLLLSGLYLLLLALLALLTLHGRPNSEHLRFDALSAAVIALVSGGLLVLVLRALRRNENLLQQQQTAEQALRASEAKYRALVENIPQRVFIKDRESRYVAVNRPYASDRGLTPEQIVGRSDYDLHPREMADKYRAADQRVMQSGEIADHDEAVAGNDNEYLVHTIKTPVRNETGEVIGVCGIYWDITEQRLLQDRLRESEQRLRAVFENVQDGILAAELATGRLIMANPAGCRMLGYREAELLELSIANLHPPDALTDVASHVNAMEHGKYYLVQDMPTLRKDGSLFYADIGTGFFTLDGKACHLGVFRDVTEIRQIREALRASEARLREAQQLARIGNWELLLDGETLHWSDEIFRIFELDPAKDNASYAALIALIHPDDTERAQLAYHRAFHHDTPYDLTYRLLLPADRRIKHVRERGAIYKDSEGRPIRLVGTVQDITEQALAEEEILSLNETLEQRVAARTEELARANRELESFSYSVSHDLRAPLRAINGFAHLLQEGEAAALTDEGRTMLERIVHNTNRMGELIDDILDYSRASQAALRHREVDLSTLVGEICAELLPAHPKATVHIGALGRVWGDAAMLRQVFDNLVGNALKYAGKRDAPHIEIDAETGTGEAVLFVRDNGAGFDMQYAGKLFGMFQRMHTDKEFPGTGVGLAITKRIIERHGGRIWAEATRDGGATFRLVLPGKPAQT